MSESLAALAQESRFVNALLWASLAVTAGVALGYHAQLCFFPYQLSPSEAGFYQSVRGLHLGLNPWSPENAPDYFNTYGIAFPWLVQQLKRFAQELPLLTVMRLTTAGGIFLALGMIFLALRDGGAKALESVAACLCVYAALLYSDTPYARADGLTVALYMLGAVWALRAGPGNAVMAGALAALAYFAKPQGLLTAPVAMALLWAQGRRRDALLAGLATAVLWAVLAGLMLWKFPYYFEGTALLHFGASQISWRWMLDQWNSLLQIHWPLILLAAAALLWALRRGRPVLPQGLARAWAWASLAVWVVLSLGPGAHVGAWLTYYNQQFLPIFFVFIVLWLLQIGLSRQLLTLALSVTAASCLGVSLAKEPLPSAGDLQVWKAADQWVGEHPFGLYPPIFTTLVVKHQAFLFDTDHSHCLVWSRGLGRHVLADAWEQKVLTADEALRDVRFQTVVCCSYWPCPKDMEKHGYREVAPFDFRDGRNRFQVFVPRVLPAPTHAR